MGRWPALNRNLEQRLWPAAFDPSISGIYSWSMISWWQWSSSNRSSAPKLMLILVQSSAVFWHWLGNTSVCSSSIFRLLVKVWISIWNAKHCPFPKLLRLFWGNISECFFTLNNELIISLYLVIKKFEYARFEMRILNRFSQESKAQATRLGLPQG